MHSRSGRARASELEAALEARGFEPFHARQLFRWIYRRGIVDFDRDDRSRRGRCAAQLQRRLHDRRRRESSSDERSTDGTRKFVLELADGSAASSRCSSPTRRP